MASNPGVGSVFLQRAIMAKTVYKTSFMISKPIVKLDEESMGAIAYPRVNIQFL